MITDALRRHVALDGSEELLDRDRLSALLERPVVLTALRIKPGESLLVAWKHEAGLSGHGWAMLVTSDDKLNGIVRRAAKSGGGVVLRPHHGAHLLVGGVDTDPRLARALARALRRLDQPFALEVLRYNPGRRLVVRARGEQFPGAGVVLRVATKSLDGLREAERRWAQLGAPVVQHARWGRRDTAVVAPFWGIGNLSDIRDEAAARLCGRTIAQVHEASMTGVAEVHDVPRPPKDLEVVRTLLPGHADLIDAIAGRLDAAPAQPSSPVALHGDLSPDQILTDGHSVRIADLDRAHVGPAGLDLGSWSADCRVSGARILEEAFLDGYASVRLVPELAAWRARALLVSALKPLRQGSPRWQAEMEDRVRLAACSLDLDHEGPRA